MSTAGVLSIREPGFTANAVRTQTSLALRFSGNADMAAVAELDRFLTAAHEAAQKARVREVHVEMHELYFMNSSCLARVIAWLSVVSELPLSERYVVVFKANPNLRWQVRSLQSLKQIGTGFVVVA